MSDGLKQAREAVNQAYGLTSTAAADVTDALTSGGDEFLVEMAVQRGFGLVAPIWNTLNQDGLVLGYIAGSFAAWMAAPRRPGWRPNDIDVFALSEWSFDCLKESFLKLELAIEEEGDIVVQWKPSHLSPVMHDVQLLRPHPRWSSRNIQLDILTSFDLSVSRALLASPEMVRADRTVGTSEGKVLIVNDPVKTLMRLLKYHKRGVEFPINEATKVFRAWSAMDEATRSTLLEMHESEDEESFDEYDWYKHDNYFRGE